MINLTSTMAINLLYLRNLLVLLVLYRHNCHKVISSHGAKENGVKSRGTRGTCVAVCIAEVRPRYWQPNKTTMTSLFGYGHNDREIAIRRTASNTLISH